MCCSGCRRGSGDVSRLRIGTSTRAAQKRPKLLRAWEETATLIQFQVNKTREKMDCPEVGALAIEVLTPPSLSVHEGTSYGSRWLLLSRVQVQDGDLLNA